MSGWYQIECWGAQGGGGSVGNAGLGGYAKGLFHFEAGESFGVYVGGAGVNSALYNPGGWNGGGTVNGIATVDSSSGGGATDVRVGSSLYNRIIVAGGGGGNSDDGSAPGNKSGGHGGGLNGGASPRGVAGGTQTSGYSFGYGQGLTGACRGGGGGGGWYGGYATMDYKGGGGGSSYISGHPGCTISPTGYIGENCTTSTGVRKGHGYARIVLTKK